MDVRLSPVILGAVNFNLADAAGADLLDVIGDVDMGFVDHDDPRILLLGSGCGKRVARGYGGPGIMLEHGVV